MKIKAGTTSNIKICFFIIKIVLNNYDAKLKEGNHGSITEVSRKFKAFIECI